MVKIDFEQQTRHGMYRDALTLPENHGLSRQQLEELMQQRVDAWVAYMDNPPQPEPEPEYVEIDGVKYLKVG